MRSSWVYVAVCTIFCVIASGCASTEVDNVNERLTSLEEVSKKPPNATYIVEPPDSIRVNVLGETDVNVTAQVRQDGIVTLPHLGETKVAMMTTQEIQDKLEEQYADYYQNPQVRVTVTQYRSKKIYVYGEVQNPGPQAYTGYQLLSEAIGSAGGLTHRADYNEVKIVRGDPEDPKVFWADLNKLIYQGKTKQNVSLAQSDVVYVRPSALAWVGYRIQEVMFPFTSLFHGLRAYDTTQDVLGGND